MVIDVENLNMRKALMLYRQQVIVLADKHKVDNEDVKTLINKIMKARTTSLSNIYQFLTYLEQKYIADDKMKAFIKDVKDETVKVITYVLAQKKVV